MDSGYGQCYRRKRRVTVVPVSNGTFTAGILVSVKWAGHPAAVGSFVSLIGFTQWRPKAPQRGRLSTKWTLVCQKSSCSPNDKILAAAHGEFLLLANFCTYLGDRLRWAFASLVARHCALYCFVVINFMLLLHKWLNKLIDWLIDWLIELIELINSAMTVNCYVFAVHQGARSHP